MLQGIAYLYGFQYSILDGKHGPPSSPIGDPPDPPDPALQLSTDCHCHIHSVSCHNLLLRDTSTGESNCLKMSTPRKCYTVSRHCCLLMRKEVMFPFKIPEHSSLIVLQRWNVTDSPVTIDRWTLNQSQYRLQAKQPDPLSHAYSSLACDNQVKTILHQQPAANSLVVTEKINWLGVPPLQVHILHEMPGMWVALESSVMHSREVYLLQLVAT